MYRIQSIDKMWYDWQNRDANNKNAFAGGSISFQLNITQLYAQYPTVLLLGSMYVSIP